MTERRSYSIPVQRLRPLEPVLDFVDPYLAVTTASPRNMLLGGSGRSVPQRIRAKRPELSPIAARAFSGLAESQRGLPEELMLKAQRQMGGGVMPWALEHTGDLTHRMAQHGGTFGAEYVTPKVDSLLRVLKNPYGFEREYLENLRANKLMRENVVPILREYSAAHAKLPVYNYPQRLARDAAVSLGNEKFDLTIANLEKLQKMIQAGRFDWNHNMFIPEYDLGRR